MGKNNKKRHKLIYLVLLYSCCLSLAGCATLSHEPRFLHDGAEAEPSEYINKATVYYASEIEDRGWQLKDYEIETGDVLNISVWQIEDLRRTVVVRPDGKISFPLIGDVQAKGVTIENLRVDLEDMLNKYIRIPQVSVIVQSFGGKRAIVIDESGGGGIIRFAEPVRIIEALAMAGGYNADINLSKIYVVRGGLTPGDEPKIIVVNAHKIFREADMRENILIHANDIIFLARGWLSSLTEFTNQIDSVISHANHYRNMDNIAPWNYKTTDIDLREGDFIKDDWGIGSEN